MSVPTWAAVVGDGPVRCGCGRRAQARDCVDLRALGTGPAFVCDACWAHLPARHGVARSALLARLGAPAAVVQHHRNKEAGRFPPRADERGQG